MRITGLLLGFLLLNSAVPAYRVVAQVAPQPTGSATSQTEPSTGQTTASNSQESSSSKKETDEGGSGDRKLHLRLGPIFLGAGYAHFSGPAYHPYGPYDFYPPGSEYSAFWFPYWGPNSFFAHGYFGYGSAKGEVRLSAEPKTAEVYLDRAYAGTADHLKNIWLEPGAYDLSVAATGHEAFHQRIYVLSGKSLKITAKLVNETKPGEIKDKP
jgi:hypothetical protein